MLSGVPLDWRSQEHISDFVVLELFDEDVAIIPTDSDIGLSEDA